MSHPYRALDLLTRGGYAPKVDRRDPYWRPPVAKAARHVHLPAWDWESATVGDTGDEMIDLDVSGAFVAAITSADFAHGALTRTGPWTGIKPAPGYYQILTPAWQVPGIVSPLGGRDMPDAVWVMHPTLKLLQDLEADGDVGAIEVHDSYTATTNCRLRKWGEKLRDDRRALIAARNATEPDTVARAAADKAYTEFKNAFSQAIQMMAGKDDADGERTTNKSEVLRPDWYHTIHAQHAATMWRKVWRTLQAGIPPFAMGSKDEVTYRQEDWQRILDMKPRPQFRIDQTGGDIGSFKIKDMWVLS